MVLSKAVSALSSFGKKVWDRDNLTLNHFNTPTIASGYLLLHSTMNEFIYCDTPNLPSQGDIIAAHAKMGDRTRQFTYLSKDRKFFIKYGFSVKVGEAKNQHYFYKKIRSQCGTAVKIPKIHHAFETRGRTYIVMEYIDIVSYASDEERANAVAQLVSIEPPSGATLGPIGGGPIKHCFFIDNESPRRYLTVQEMQTYINNV